MRLARARPTTGGAPAVRSKLMQRSTSILPILAGFVLGTLFNSIALADGDAPAASTAAVPAAATQPAPAVPATATPAVTTAAAPTAGTVTELGAIKVEGARLNRARDTLN